MIKVNHIRTLPLVRLKGTPRAFSAHVCAAAPSDVFVLDFDGVLADSQHEVSSAGLNAAIAQWPSIFQALSREESDRIMAGLSTARPRLVQGFETMVMARLIAEDNDNLEKIMRVEGPAWDAPDGLLQKTLAAWGADGGSLMEDFELLRKERMFLDDEAYGALIPLYEGIEDAINACQSPFYIASSKRTDRLLRYLNVLLKLGFDESTPRVFGSLTPPNEMKIAALRSVMSRPIASDLATSLHFVDDRFETIAAVAGETDIQQRYNLYLAGWGYNTAEERAEAEKIQGVRVITLPQFCELLTFGIIMGVDDGCQDTEEEALAAVYTPRQED